MSQVTEEPTDLAGPVAPRRPARAVRWLVGFSGALCVALVLLGLAVLGARLVVGAAGPTVAVVAAQLGAAVLSLLLQRCADRGAVLPLRGPVAAGSTAVRVGCAAAVLVLTATVLTLYWWF